MSSKVNMKAQVVISVFLVLMGSTAWAGRSIKVPLDFENILAAIEDALSDVEILALHGDGPQR